MALTVADIDLLLKGSVPAPTTSYVLGVVGSITLEIAAALKMSAEAISARHTRNGII